MEIPTSVPSPFEQFLLNAFSSHMLTSSFFDLNPSSLFPLGDSFYLASVSSFRSAFASCLFLGVVYPLSVEISFPCELVVTFYFFEATQFLLFFARAAAYTDCLREERHYVVEV